MRSPYARRSDITCACGQPMLRSSEACKRCLYKARGYQSIARSQVKPINPNVAKHVPSGHLLDMHPVEVAWKWRIAVCR